MDQLVAMRAFVRVAQTQSFQEAAKLENLAQGTVSKRVSALEKHLGAQLFRRNQRGVTLTVLGEAYFEECLEILDAVEKADKRVKTDADAPSGPLRVSMSPVLARLVIAPILAEFVEASPRISVHSFLTEDHVDIVGEGIDVAIRARHLEDSSLFASRISSNPLTLAAAPRYLSNAPMLETPEHLTGHNCLVFSRMKSSQKWQFKQGRKKREVVVQGKLSADQGDTLAELAAKGAGVVLMPEWVMKTHLESGSLVKVLPDWTPPSIPLHIVYSTSKTVPLRTRLLVDFIRRKIRSDNLLPR